MPVSIVCEPVPNVSAVLRESLGNGYSSNGRSMCKSGGVGDSYINDDDGCLQTKLAVTAKRVLLSKIEYEEVTNYSQSVLGALKSKYDILKASTPNKNLSYDYLSLGKCSSNTERNDVASNLGLSNNGSNANASTSKRHNPNELPQPKRVLYPRENIIIGWKNSVRKWQVGVGMMNVGNTCYLNSTLQALFHVPSLANWLMSEAKHLGECESPDNCIICAMVKTLEASQGNQSAIRPYLVYSKLKFICKHLLMGRQEDAHEFLRYLVEAMEKSYLTRFRNYKEFDQYSKETTPLNQILGGYLKSAVRCLSCGHVSVTFQHFQDLLLDIRKADTVEEALDGYFSRERLEDMGYKCESCKKKVSATKQFSLERAPIVLCIQLKRFSVMGTKLNKQITIKPRIDLSKFISRKESGEQLTYKLVAMVTHLGASQHCGHYTAIGLTESGSYYNYDDSYVRPVSVQNVCNTNAYIIFYEIEKSQRSFSSIDTGSINDSVKENAIKQNGYARAENIFPSQLCSSTNSQYRFDSNLLTGGIKSLPSHYVNKPSTSNGSISNKVISNRQIHYKNQTISTPLKSNTAPAIKSPLFAENRNSAQVSLEQNSRTLFKNDENQKINHSSFGFREASNKLNSSVNENQICSSIEAKGNKFSEISSSHKASATLPSMPTLSDVQNHSAIQPAKYASLPVSPLKSLVPYESETDEESTTSEMKDTLICSEELNKKKKDFKSAIKRPMESPLSNTNSAIDSVVKPKKLAFVNDDGLSSKTDSIQLTANKNDFNNSLTATSEHSKNKLQKHGNSQERSNTYKSDETSVNDSKIRHKVDMIDEIFNKKKHDCDNGDIVSSDEFINKPPEETECENILISSRPPFKRSHSTPPSPPVIKTKTGLWQVTTLQPVTACISPPEQKIVKNPKNPFAKKPMDSFNKRQKPNMEGKSDKAQFIGNGYRCSNVNDNSISGLMKQSHRGYGVPVLSWKGEQTKLSKEVETDAQQQRQHDWQDEEDAEIDRGRQKKVKNKDISAQSDNRIPGYNPFQEADNQRRWRSGGAANRPYSGYVRQQFQRNKFKFQRFNPKFQRITAVPYKRNNHRLNNGYARRNS
ncbi:PREDICTED: ubiquitin carboxyl-terminal hydrolase 36 [Rhagoletis zephyria]|uniref:ubiquitin carboxyl-terminal hydrolase 36 n=1 Tax=Rhagoletis zephyria TaxID=28612 RepID=UPI0008119624|nr:PREDICTED: ubiquitin carboxyl-terminal hydrolase 36 [Rhagoletis zephyria]